MLNNKLRRIYRSAATSSIEEMDAALTSIKGAKRGAHRVDNITQQERATIILKLSQDCPDLENLEYFLQILQIWRILNIFSRFSRSGES